MRIIMNCIAAGAVAAGIASGGCGYTRKSEAFSATARFTDPKFSVINQYIIRPKCLECHRDDESLDGYAAVSEFVRPGDPEDSELYEEIISGSMPIGQPMLSDDDILLIYKWIKNGAQND